LILNALLKIQAHSGFHLPLVMEYRKMQWGDCMKKTRGGRLVAAKKRAAKVRGGHGRIKSRPAGRHIMQT